MISSRKIAIVVAGATLPLLAAPVQALPLIGIGASVGAYYWNVGAPGVGSAIDLDGKLHFLPINLGANVVAGLGNGAYLARAELRKDIDVIPMLSLTPTLGYVTENLYGAAFGNAASSGPEASLEARFSPILSPVYVEGRLGASYLLSPPAAGNALVPDYNVGIGLAFTPFSTIEVRYRGFNAGGNQGGLELGLRLGI